MTAPVPRPVSVPALTRKPLVIGVAACLLLVFGIGGWAATTQLSGAVIAPGKLVVDTNVKKIQHPTGGVVGELLVKEGDRVKQGDVVVRLDGTQAKANLGIVTKSLDELAARQARFEAERDNDKTVEFPHELTWRKRDPEIARLMSGEQMVWTSDRQGELGRGEYINAENLLPGWHRITLTVTDRSGMSTQVSIWVHIGLRLHLPLAVK